MVPDISALLVEVADEKGPIWSSGYCQHMETWTCLACSKAYLLDARSGSPRCLMIPARTILWGSSNKPLQGRKCFWFNEILFLPWQNTSIIKHELHRLGYSRRSAPRML